jgi:hypothetical protein
MHTRTPQDTKYLSFRIDRDLWIRLGDAVRRLGTSSQAFCTGAIEIQLSRAARKLNNPGDQNLRP